jgi:hypothetical protein
VNKLDKRASVGESERLEWMARLDRGVGPVSLPAYEYVLPY